MQLLSVVCVVYVHVVYVCTVCVVRVCGRVTWTVPKHQVQNLQPLHWAKAAFQGFWSPQGQASSLFSCFFIMSCDSPRSACPQLQITGKIRIIIGKYWIGELDAILYFDKTILFLNNFKIMIFFKKSTVFCCLENTLDCMESHQGLHPDGRAWNPELLTPCRKQQMLSDQEDVSSWLGH